MNTISEGIDDSTFVRQCRDLCQFGFHSASRMYTRVGQCPMVDGIQYSGAKCDVPLSTGYSYAAPGSGSS